jgi:hypothetical protein
MDKITDTPGIYSSLLLVSAVSSFGGFIVYLFPGAQGTERCIKEGEALDRGFSLPYTEGTFSELHIWFYLFAVQLTLRCWHLGYAETAPCY